MTVSLYHYSNECQSHYLCLEFDLSWWFWVLNLLQQFFHLIYHDYM